MITASTMPTLGASHESPTQYPRFRVTDLTNLNDVYTALSNGTMGINNKGQVVYGRYDSGSAKCRGEPCTCQESESATSGGGLSLERFTEVMAELSAQLTEEQIAFAWQRFLNYYYQ